VRPRRSKNGGARRDRWFTPEDEQSFFYEFVSRAGSVIPAGFDSWDILFLMRQLPQQADPAAEPARVGRLTACGGAMARPRRSRRR